MTAIVEGTPPPAGGLAGTVVVPGLEARHTIDDVLTLGDLTVWPRFRIRDIEGLRASPDGEILADPSTGRVGEQRRKRDLRGKTLPYALTLEARNLTELRAGQALAAKVFAEDAEVRVTISQHPNLPDRVPDVVYWASVGAIDTGTEKPKDRRRPQTGGYEQDFVASLRMHDPRFYSVEQVSGETAAFVDPVGFTLPASLPFRIPAPDTTAGFLELDNVGAVDTDPIIDIWGPISSPVLENLTTGGRLVFAGLSLGANEFVRVDFFRRTVRRQDEADYRRFVNRAASTWWDSHVQKIAPGPNTFRLTAASVANPARAEIRFLPATLR